MIVLVLRFQVSGFFDLNVAIRTMVIRGNEATKDIPVVMISGKDGFFDKVRGRMAGTTGYITKPFGPETLMKMLETYIV